MNPSVLLLLPPFAFLLWRPEWPAVAVLLGAMALVAWRDWAAQKANWNGSVSVDIDHANHAIKAVGARLDKVEAAWLEAAEAQRQKGNALALKVKAAEDALEGHSRALQQAATKPRSIL